MAAIRPAHEHAALLAEAARARNFDATQTLQHLDQRLLTALSNVLGRDDLDRL